MVEGVEVSAATVSARTHEPQRATGWLLRRAAGGVVGPALRGAMKQKIGHDCVETVRHGGLAVNGVQACDVDAVSAERDEEAGVVSGGCVCGCGCGCGCGCVHVRMCGCI